MILPYRHGTSTRFRHGDVGKEHLSTIARSSNLHAIRGLLTTHEILRCRERLSYEPVSTFVLKLYEGLWTDIMRRSVSIHPGAPFHQSPSHVYLISHRFKQTQQRYLQSPISATSAGPVYLALSRVGPIQTEATSMLLYDESPLSKQMSRTKDRISLHFLRMSCHGRGIEMLMLSML